MKTFLGSVEAWIPLEPVGRGKAHRDKDDHDHAQAQRNLSCQEDLKTLKIDSFLFLQLKLSR